MAGLTELFAPQQAPDYSSALEGLQGAQDRITQFLQQNAQPQTAPTLGQIGPMALDLMRGGSYSESLGNMINQQRQQELGNIDLALSQADIGLKQAELMASQGNPDAKAVMDALAYFTEGMDYSQRAKLFAAASDDPRPITAQNAMSVFAELSSGIQGPADDAPAGYRWTPQGTLEAITGGPEDLSVLAARAAATRAPDAPAQPTDFDRRKSLLDSMLENGTISPEEHRLGLMELGGLDTEGMGGGATFDEGADKLRADFDARPEVKAWRAIEPIVAGIPDLVATNSKASDLALVNAFAKIMDPNSVVREGEIAMVENTSPIYGRLNALAAELSAQGRLLPETKAELAAMIDLRSNSYREVYDAARSEFARIAEANGVNPDQIWGAPLLPAATVTTPTVIEYDEQGNRLN